MDWGKTSIYLAAMIVGLVISIGFSAMFDSTRLVRLWMIPAIVVPYFTYVYLNYQNFFVENEKGWTFYLITLIAAVPVIFGFTLFLVDPGYAEVDGEIVMQLNPIWD